MSVILFSFFFFLPAGIANMMPVFATKIPILGEYNFPLDFGKTFRGKRILGDHKTIRGLIVGVLVGTITFILLYNIILALPAGRQVGPKFSHPLLLGFLLSFGALAGDSIKSFFKRQIGIPSGKTWFPFDQIDYIVGGLVVSLLIIQLQFIDYIIIFLLYFVLHLVVSFLGFLFHLKQAPF